MTVSPRSVRRFSLVALLAWLLLLGGMFAERQLRRRPTVSQIDLGQVAAGSEETAVRVHRGFEYSDTLGIEPNFRVAASETVEFASGWYELRDVEVSLFHRGQVAYGLASQRARFNPGLREAKVTGEAQLSLGRGIAARAEGFVLRGPEREFASSGAVTFAGAGWAGVAGGLSGRLAENILEIVGGLSASTRQRQGEPALVLLAPSARYRRSAAHLELSQGVTLLKGGLEVRAPRAEIQLNEAEGVVRRVALAGGVRVEGAFASGEEILLDGDSATVEVSEEGRLRLTAQPTPAGWVRATWRDGGGTWREFSAWRVVGEGTESSWEWLEGQEMACAEEYTPGTDLRTMSAYLLRVAFAGRVARTIEASGSVRLAEGSTWAEGESLSSTIAERTFVLTGAGGSRVSLGTSEATCTADRVEGGPGDAVTAIGEVMGRLARGVVLGESPEPTRFAAASARWKGSRATLDGQARLWQGARLLRADVLDYDRGAEVVNGTGHVLTVGRLDKGGAPGDTIEVQSRSLAYDRRAGRAVWEGEVTVKDARAVSQCQRLSAALAPDGSFRAADLEGGVAIVERGTGRELRGERARLRPDEDVLDVWGQPVLVREVTGNQVKGEHLSWNRATGTIVVVGEPGSPSETLYHPQAEGGAKPPRRTP